MLWDLLLVFSLVVCDRNDGCESFAAAGRALQKLLVLRG